MSKEPTTMAQAVATEHTEMVQAALLGQLTDARKALGLTQAELAGRVGISRMTVQRAEAPEADPQLSSFVALALALNLVPQLRANDDEMGPPAAQDLVHRGLHHVRTRHDLEFRDREREAAFAGAWEAANRHDAQGLTAVAPLLSELVPGCTQDQASTAATVVQWLGTTVGFEFLEQALGAAGYAVVDKRKAKK
jgi:transcriptional regulator with XRE-family HTH domain